MKHTEALGALYFEKIGEEFRKSDRQKLGELIFEVKSECKKIGLD